MIETTVPGATSEEVARRLLTRVLASVALRPKRVADFGQAMPCAVYLLDIQRGELVYDNHRVAELLGLDADATAERQERDGFAARIHPDDAVEMFAELAKWDAADDSAAIEARFRLRHRDGRYRWFLARTVLESRDEEGRAQRVLGCAMQFAAPPESPRNASKDAASENTTGAGPRPDLGKTVLLVDERPDILRVAARVLLDAGYLVLTATSGYEALAHSDHALASVSVLVCEVDLPDIPGTDLAARLEERGQDAPTLYLSSRAPDERFAEAARGTRYTFSRKPFAPAELVRHVEFSTRG